MRKTQVLIVGAGPAGLMLALRLARHNIAVRIIDKKPRHHDPGTGAMVIHARTLEFYQQLGFVNDFLKQGIRIRNLHLREGDEDAVNLAMDSIGEGLTPFPFVLALPQVSHEFFLMERLAATGITLEWGVELVSLSQTDTHVDVVLNRGGAEETCQVAYVCGCDGVSSRVRDLVGLAFEGDWDERLYYVADVEVQGERPGTDAFLQLGDTGFALLMPVWSVFERVMGVVPVECGDASDFDAVRPSVDALLGIKVGKVDWYATYRVRPRVATAFRAGRCFLLGDAGHTHSPAGAQGMNSGIGDAVNLSWKLAYVLQGRANVALLDTYEAERRPFARALMATTDRVFQVMTDDGKGAELLRTWLLPTLAPLFTGFAAGRRAVFETLSQVRLDYEDSPLSIGKAGHVHGGDRLPWVFDSVQNNFDPLESVNWQVHVYGALKPDTEAAVRALSLELHCFTWCEEAERAGLQEDSVYIVRPDGYVALAATQTHFADIDALVDEFGLRFSPIDDTDPWIFESAPEVYENREEDAKWVT